MAGYNIRTRRLRQSPVAHLGPDSLAFLNFSLKFGFVRMSRLMMPVVTRYRVTQVAIDTAARLINNAHIKFSISAHRKGNARNRAYSKRL